MKRNKILYISTNDGSDMRINKEIKTLSVKADVYFLGVGQFGKNNYAEKLCKEFYLIEEKRNSVKAVFKQIKKYLNLCKTENFDSIHVINEQLMVFFYPWLFKEYVVLDIFDSFFMRKNKARNKLKWLKRLVYWPVDYVFVTDKNRYGLMPDFIKNKLGILENYPNRYSGSVVKDNEGITIFYNGTMNDARGTKFLQDLTNSNDKVKVIMAGWTNDQNTTDFTKSHAVDFRGMITQSEATKIAATESDYIMCCYEPSNQNNINASPNKIYDAIQTHTPVIMNAEVKVSKFVNEMNIGLVLDSFYTYDIESVYDELLSKLGTFSFSEENANNYSWENIESKLLEAHKLI
jgi:hypothetical protein